MNTTLVHNYIMDLKKKDIDKFERAEIINEFLEKEKISQREFARIFAIPRSTVEDWLLISKISKEDYDKMKLKNNLTDTDMYRVLRSNRKKSEQKILEIPGIDIILGKLLILMQNMSNIIKKKGTINYTNDTIGLISKNIILLQQLEKYIKDKEEKNGKAEV